MSTDDRRWKRLLTDLRNSASDPRSAYLIRSRSQRLLVSIRKDVLRAARHSSAPEIEAVLTRALSKSRQLARMSETLDARWTAEWESLVQDLDQLEAALNRVVEVSSVSS